MFKHRLTVRVLSLAMAIGVAACGQATTAQSSVVPSPSAAISAPSDSPIVPPSAEAGASGSPTPTEAVIEPTPRPRLARWSTEPRRILSGYCSTPVATVDQASQFHVAAICEDRIRYATSADGKSWKTSTLAAPPDGSDLDPQLAVDGSTLYLAYTHRGPVDLDTCGGPDPRLGARGVYYRTRSLPSGGWSEPTRIGRVGDQLRSLRVVDGVIHETIVADDGLGPTSYGSQDGTTFREVKIPAAEATSLRVGDDGRPRIAYTSGSAIKYAVVTGDRLSTARVFSADDVQMQSPVLVLGSDDHAFVSWAALEIDMGGGCESPEPPKPTHKGTWFATDVDGRWATKRLSKDVGSALLALDVVRGRLHAIYSDSRGIRYVTRASDGTWSGSRLDVSRDFSGSVLRRDPATGLLLLIGRMLGEDETDSGIYAVTGS
jgi:hypothetical protein